MERTEDLQYKGLRLIQDPELFCFGTDAVLLADFAEIPARSRVVDLGTGTGILPVLMYARQENARYFGVELQERLCDMARRSVELNGLGDRIELVCGDLLGAHRLFGNANDVVVSNPPYEKEGTGAVRASESHRIARKETHATFGQICKSAAQLLKTGGKFYFIHRPARLPELFSELKNHGLEPKKLRLAYARLADEPKYALVCAVKGGGEALRVMPPLILRNADGTETEELKKIYHREEG